MSLISCLAIVVLVGPAAQTAKGDFPPLPDFRRRVDYVAWYERVSRVDADENAYSVYAEFMPGFVGSKVSEEEWPGLAGFLTSHGNVGDPVPWAPDLHPEWEDSYQRTREVLQKFALAAKKKHLVAPSGLATGVDAVGNLLGRMRFSYLEHLKQCAVGKLEAAWRMEERTVSASRLLSAVRTNLRVARQLERSLFTTEQLVALSMRTLTYDHVAWALAHGVLGEDDVKKLRKLLQRTDGRPIDCSRSMCGEAGILLDGLQYMYGPLVGGGRPKLNGNRYREVTGHSMGGADRLGLGARLETDTAGTAKAILDAFVRAADLMGPTYEAGRMQEIKATIDRMEKFNHTTKAMCFNQAYGVGRTYLLSVGCETQRRATQLLVELFRYKARKGKWPKKLSSLSKKVRKRVGRDPFGTGAFRYRLSDDGPVLYSVSLNGEDDGATHAKAWGPSGDGGDHVFWPIPDSDETLAAGRLLQTKEGDLTPISAIGAKLEGKRVTVGAKVVAVSSEPSDVYGRLFTVTLAQGEHSITLVYGREVAEGLSDDQAVEPGKTVRFTARVVVADDGLRLELQDALDLVVED